MADGTTFRSIDRSLGVADNSAADSPLAEWYEAARDRPIENLSIDDLCKACRQEVHLDHVVAVALDRLERDFLAGERYEGELLAALAGVPRRFWEGRERLSRQALALLRRAAPTIEDEGSSADMERLRRNATLA